VSGRCGDILEEQLGLLREELGATPSPQVQALHLHLLKAAEQG
jgi:hypothetical protein